MSQYRTKQLDTAIVLGYNILMTERKRSRAYPGVALEGSIGHLKQVQAKLGLGIHGRDDLLTALGHTAESGAFNRKVGALVLFGLLDRSPSGYQITTLGKRILRPLPGEERDLYRQAFERVPLYKEVCDEFRPEERLPGHLDRLLERSFGIVAPNGEFAAKVLMDSGQFAGALSAEGEFLSDEPQPQSEQRAVGGPIEQETAAELAPQKPANRSEIRMERPAVVLQAPTQMTAKDIERIKRWLEAVVTPWLTFLAEADDEGQPDKELGVS